MDTLIIILKICAFLGISLGLMYITYLLIKYIVIPIVAVVVSVTVFWVVVILVFALVGTIYNTNSKKVADIGSKQKTEQVR